MQHLVHRFLHGNCSVIFKGVLSGFSFTVLGMQFVELVFVQISCISCFCEVKKKKHFLSQHFTPKKSTWFLNNLPKRRARGGAIKSKRKGACKMFILMGNTYKYCTWRAAAAAV
jgi:hypothetical protein